MARPDSDQGLTHVGVVGDTYTILLTGAGAARLWPRHPEAQIVSCHW